MPLSVLVNNFSFRLSKYGIKHEGGTYFPFQITGGDHKIKCESGLKGTCHNKLTLILCYFNCMTFFVSLNGALTILRHAWLKPRERNMHRCLFDASAILFSR